MRIKYLLYGIGYYLFTEILCLFLALTLSAMGGTLLRIISMICTMGVQICLYVNFGVTQGKKIRLRHESYGIFSQFFMSLCAAFPYIILGIVLLLAHGGQVADGFYRWYKLLNAPQLQLCNIFCDDISASALTLGQTLMLSLLTLIPLGVTWIASVFSYKGISSEDLQYKS